MTRPGEAAGAVGRGRRRGQPAQARRSDKICYVNFCAGLTALSLVLSVLPARASPSPPSLVFLLLDTTRADRLGAWGGPNPTSPNLDALAAGGVRFARHYANSHATRPSMPQLMSGRYYHQNILVAFRPTAHPREFPFSRRDPTAVLLPRVLRDAGYQTLAASAHPWVARESAFGEPFEVFELLLPADASHGHADAREVVDRGLALWRSRDRVRPTFLYLHFMDPHMPRFLPGGVLRFPAPGGATPGRFRPDGEPDFGRQRRSWSRFDARDFTIDDARYFAAVYDTLVAFLDEQLGRLLSGLREDDPELRRTLIVVTSDHGEELGDQGRLDHGDSLADAVQHVPWIMAGAGIARGRVLDRFTEHVDVVPTLLSALAIPLPPGTHVDGRSQLGPDGAPCAPCAKQAAYYAWEDYRAIRRRRMLLRRNPPGSLRAACDGELQVFAVPERGDRVSVAADGAQVRALARRLDNRLGALATSFLASRYGPATQRVTLRSEFWRLEGPGTPRCVPVDGDTGRAALAAPGWLATGRGVALLDADGAVPITVSIDLPDGGYAIELALVPAPPLPRLFGFAGWRKATFLPDLPAAFVPVGRSRASNGRLRVVIDPADAAGNRILGLRATPEGVVPPAETPAPDEEQLRRLRALGYVR